MAIKITVGIEFYGLIRQPDRSVVATRCAHVMFLPVIPLGTWRIGLKAEKAPFSALSLFSAFFKPWAFVWALLLGGIGLFSSDWFIFPAHKVMTVVSALLFAGAYASWLWLGHGGRTSAKRYGIVGAMAAVTFATIAVFSVMQLQTSAQLAMDPDYDEQLVTNGNQPANQVDPNIEVEYAHELVAGDLIEVHTVKGYLRGVVVSQDDRYTTYRAGNREYASPTYQLRKLTKKSVASN